MSVRVIQLSDVHFGGEAVAATAAAADYVRADPPNLVVLTGDLTLNGLPREFRAGAAWWKGLPEPRLATPGNHDTPYWNIPLRALTPFARYRRFIGDPFHGGFDSPEFAVRMINTSRGAQPRLDWSKGAINLGICRAAAAEVAASAPGGLRVISCHHPLVEAAGAPVTGGVHRGTEAASILAEGGVDLILTGHVHNPFAVPLPTGDHLTYAVGAGTLSLRTRGTPPGFNTIEWDRDAVTVTAQAWTGARFEPFRSWSLPRRKRTSASAP